MDTSSWERKADQQAVDTLIGEALRSIRTLLGMKVAFISEFANGQQVFRYVEADADFRVVQVGGSAPLEHSYCQRVLDGRLPGLMQDARTVHQARELPVTLELPIGAHISVPLTLPDGRLYGTLCCFSNEADHTLNARDHGAMQLLALFIGKLIASLGTQSQPLSELRQLLLQALEQRHYHIVYQPIIFVAQHRVVGYEALTRFSLQPHNPPDYWFNEAARVGLQEELELCVIRTALEALPHFAEEIYISLNLSPATLLSAPLDELLAGYPLRRIMLEVTEHASVEDYTPIAEKLAPLRARGLRLAVDDAGAGYASFRHILKLKPDVIKLDRSLIQKIDSELESRALAAALIRFAEETGCKVVAEGVETQAELDILRELKVNKVQGYLLGRPLPLEQLLQPGDRNEMPGGTRLRGSIAP